MKLYKGVLLAALYSITTAQRLRGRGGTEQDDATEFVDNILVTHDADNQAILEEDRDLPIFRMFKEPEEDNEDDDKHPQYAFAHRLNDEDYIQSALDGGISGIECDVIWSAWRRSWVVQHDTPNLSWVGPTLNVWLSRLKTLLDTNDYDFSALWLDIKSPNDNSLHNVMKTVHDIFPEELKFAVIYDLNDKDNILDSLKGYEAIKSSLKDNEGIGVWLKAGEEYSTPSLMEKFEQDGITRTSVSHGHSLDIDEETLEGINSINDQSNPYCFKKVFTWTMSFQSTMEDHIDPSRGHRTDGQIIGNPYAEWKPALIDDIEDFERAVEKYSSTQRMARPSDSFWSVSPQPTSIKVAPPPLIYSIQVQTGNKRRAGTDSNIFITIYGDKGSTKETRLNGYLSGNAFERGDLDRLALQGLKNVGTLQKIKIRSDGSYWGSNWYLSWVKVNGKLAFFNEWIDGRSSIKSLQ